MTTYVQRKLMESGVVSDDARLAEAVFRDLLSEVFGMFDTQTRFALKMHLAKIAGATPNTSQPEVAEEALAAIEIADAEDHTHG